MLNIAATHAGEVGVKGVAVIGMNRIPYGLGTKTFHGNHKHLIYLSGISTDLSVGGGASASWSLSLKRFLINRAVCSIGKPTYVTKINFTNHYNIFSPSR